MDISTKLYQVRKNIWQHCNDLDTKYATIAYIEEIFKEIEGIRQVVEEQFNNPEDV